jgi:carbon-monoxide dehydrogenase catalytic subunit
VESIQYHLGGTFRGDYYTLNDNIINGRIRGIGGVVGCNNARTKHNEAHIEGGQGTDQKRRHRSDHRLQRHRLRHGRPADPGIGQGLLWTGLAEVCETVGIPPVLHLGSCVDNSRILLAATEVVKAGGLGNDISDLPAAGSAPEWMSEKAISIGQYFVASGVYTVFGVRSFPTGRPVFQRLPVRRDGKDVRRHVGFRKADPIKHAHKMIAHIDKKRKELGIDKARERVLMDMADRMALKSNIRC